ncbi:tetratricopeptide repeat protein [Archangium lansingense]|uniref:Tetratricopeptide repeat protein n=1 Tax=Archangium lansingense TaxID=2995310 RepID=A0ABT4AHY9_9BACT|nr:tetratricopeptide repeat protein [Archangium lansinium]MCY1081206.1 tetratricopeptide repeat protein [Archangium lansinium]
MMSSRSLRHVVLAFAATLAVGCAPTLKVNVLQPARVNLGASKRLTVVQTEGRKGARDFMIDELTRQARGAGYFQVTDRSDEGIVVKVAGRSVQILNTGSGPAQGQDEIGIRIDVNDWDAEKKTEVIKGTDSKGNATEREEKFYEAKTVVSVTAFNTAGKALLAEEEYEMVGRGEDKDGAIGNAARALVARILYDITPKYVTKAIRMDGDDKAQKPIIEVAEKGNVPQAITEMESYVQTNPQNSAALYNLAVLLDASGKYQEALDLYTKAISLSAKDYYVDMKAECAKRLADQQALAQ